MTTEIPKLGCVNHDCDQCYALEQQSKNDIPRIGWHTREVYFYDGEPTMHREPSIREWVGLTEGEMTQVANTAETYTESVKLTESKLKEKNT